jgi:hypothetical protein
MSRLLILGATGSLGRHVLRQALAAGHVVTVFVRTPSKLPPEVRERVSVHTGDLGAVVPTDLVRGQDVLINCAGDIADGETLVGLADRIVTCVDLLPTPEQPLSWFSQARRSSTSIRPGVAASIYRALSPATGRTGSTSSD